MWAVADKAGRPPTMLAESGVWIWVSGVDNIGMANLEKTSKNPPPHVT